MRVWLLPLLLLNVFAPRVLARSVEGTVRERGTRAPVPGALLFVPGSDAETYADENGAFVLELPAPADLGARGGPPPESATLEVEVRVDAPGYVEERHRVSFADLDETRKVDLYLTPGGDNGTFIVRERRSAANRARGAVRIEGREVNELPGTYGDPAKAIENFPSMGRVVRSQGSLFVRGASPGDTAVYVDDFEVPDLYHFTGSTSVINIPFVQSVELVPGAFSARYGRATGGLVTLSTRKLPTDDVHGFAKLDVIDGGAYVGIPLSERAAVGMSARRSWLDAIRWAQRANGGAIDEILNIPTYWDWQLKLDWDVIPGHELVLFAFGAGDRQVNVRDASANAAAYEAIDDSDFGRVSMRYRHVLGGGLTHTFTPVFGYERRVFDEQQGLRARGRETLDFQLRDELEWRGDDARILVGLDATARNDRVTYGGLLADDFLRELPSADVEGARVAALRAMSTPRVTAALFAEGVFTPHRRWMVTPGIRLDGYALDRVPEVSIEPRLALAYQALEGTAPLQLKAAFGRFAQPPTPEDVVVAKSAGRTLSLQRATHLQGGFEQRIPDVGVLTSTLYAIWREGIATRSAGFPLAPSPTASAVASTGNGFSTGAEVVLRLTPDPRYFAWLSYAVARHVRDDGPAAQALAYTYPTETDTTHLLSALGQWSLPGGFRLGARYRMATGMPFTDIPGGMFDADRGRYVPILAARNQARYPTFHVLDVRVDWAMLLPYLEADFYLDLVNVANLRFEEGRLYAFDYATSQPRLGLPTIPTLGVKVTF